MSVAWPHDNRHLGVRPAQGLRRTQALDGLDLTVNTGEVHGFLGRTAPGSPPPFVFCSACCAPTAAAPSCSAAIPGGRHRAAPPPGLRAGDVTLWPTLSGGEVIDLLGRLRGGLDPKRRKDLLERFDLDPTKKGRTYSKGNRQKVALVAALASDVELLILDEPTSGLDPFDGRGVPGLRRPRAPGRPDRAAVQPRAGRGRGAVRPGQHHPQRQDRRVRPRWPSCGT